MSDDKDKYNNEIFKDIGLSNEFKRIIYITYADNIKNDLPKMEKLYALLGKVLGETSVQLNDYEKNTIINAIYNNGIFKNIDLNNNDNDEDIQQIMRILISYIHSLSIRNTGGRKGRKTVSKKTSYNKSRNINYGM
jgi:hypothetical protein